jgi:NitT/TauT family transport system substrate-binding protein
MLRVLVLAGVSVAVSAGLQGCNSEPGDEKVGPVTPDNTTQQPPTKVSVRLLWVPQCQFAGFIVAKEKGYYEEENLDVSLIPAGPDLKPHVTVATGTDDMGISVPNSIIGARSNGVPLVTIMQTFQDSANRYVLKSENRIGNLQELKGKNVGLWLGGDEVEFVAMLKTVGMSLDDVRVISQGFSVTPFLQDEYVLSQVTVYNELNVIREQGYEGDKLQVVSPDDYDCAILGDCVFTTEKYLAQSRATVEKFLKASIRGWRYCIEQPEDALKIVLGYNRELTEDDQRAQLQAVLGLVKSGAAVEHGIGYIDVENYATAERILFDSGQITQHVEPTSAIDASAWRAVPDSIKTIQ